MGTGRENLGHSRQHCRLRSPQFHVARDGESERGFARTALCTLFLLFLKPPTFEWSWSHPSWHMWWGTGRENLGHSRQHCRLRSPQFHVARDGESERGFARTALCTLFLLFLKPPTFEWSWSHPSWHMWWALAEKILDTLDNTAACEVLSSMLREMVNLSGALHGLRCALCFSCSSSRPRSSGAGHTRLGTCGGHWQRKSWTLSTTLPPSKSSVPCCERWRI